MNIYRITAINASQSGIQETITGQETKQCIDLPYIYEAASVIANLLLTNDLRQFSC